VECKVTESKSSETDPRFVKVIKEARLELPPGRPAQQEVKVTFAFDDNQIMKCSFTDVETGKEIKIELSMTESSGADSDEIDKFLVE
jgi:molecular chaperone DnaK